MADPKPGTADSLYQDPTPAYTPVLQAINAQELQASQRYADNQADIKNIFGSLSSLSEQDSARIQNQFKNTLLEQQQNLAARTAETRKGVAAGQAQAVATGAERGQGPAMSTSPVSVAAETGIGQSQAYQTVWENLLQANKLQAQQDTATRGTGYKLEEASALKKLRQDLEDKLFAIGGQKLQVQSDIAQAKMQAKQNVLNTKYQEVQSAKAAAASLAAAKAKAANKKVTYDKNYAGTISYIGDTYGGNTANTIAVGIDQIDSKSYGDWTKAYAAWNNAYGKDRNTGTPYPADVKARVKQYFQSNYKTPGATQIIPYTQ